MLGLLLLYWIGKAFYDLAKTHGKKPWLGAFIGIASYYGLQLVVGGIAFLLTDFDEPLNSGLLGDFGLSILGILIGALGTWGLYRYLKQKWSVTSVETHREILDDDLSL